MGLTGGQQPAGVIKIGLLVSLRSQPGQGQDDAGRAEGAQVAAYRLMLGGADVKLVVEDDQGTSAGAVKAVGTMLKQKVVGIVAATTGNHLDEALAKASAASTAVLLPYDRTPAHLPAGVWMTGPDTQETDAALMSTLRAEKLSSPFVVTADGVHETALGTGDPSTTAAYDGTSLTKLVNQVSAALAAHRVDCILIAASAPTQASIVSRLQGKLSALPVLLSPEALSPDFAHDLAGSGTLAGRFTTVGVDASDATTYSRGAAASRVAAYFAALRLAAADDRLQGLFGGGSFAATSMDADTESHDAVIALEQAVESAGSTSAPQVLAALGKLTVTGADGLAGPDLDFSSSSAVPASAVVTLRATDQDPGVRPVLNPADRPTGAQAAELYWFAVPSGGS